jgi:uncharacterized RDD family membrane protein YckC
MIDHVYTVETPEQIDLVYDVAGIGSRIIAALIDHVLMLLILSLGYVVVTLLIENLIDSINTALAAGIFGILIFLFMCVYYIFFETVWNGQTPGKRMVGIRMVRVGGRPLGFLGSTIRNFIRLADFLPLLYGIGVLAMFIDRQSRRLGDMAAGALAVRERKAITLDMLTTASAKEAPVVAMADEQRIPNLNALREQDFAMVETYMRRRSQVAPEIRTRLDTTILDGLEVRLGYPVQRTTHNVEQFLFRVVAEHQLLQRTAAMAEANGALVVEPPASAAGVTQPTEEPTVDTAPSAPANGAAPVATPPDAAPSDELRDTPRDQR